MHGNNTRMHGNNTRMQERGLYHRVQERGLYHRVQERHTHHGCRRGIPTMDAGEISTMVCRAIHPPGYAGLYTTWYIHTLYTPGYTLHCPVLPARQRRLRQCPATTLWAQEERKAWVRGSCSSKSPKGVTVGRETLRRLLRSSGCINMKDWIDGGPSLLYTLWLGTSVHSLHAAHSPVSLWGVAHSRAETGPFSL